MGNGGLGAMIDWKRVADLRDEIGADGFAEVADMFLEEAEGALRALARERAPAGTRLRANVVLMRSTIGDFAALCSALADAGVDEIGFNLLGGRDRPDFHACESVLPPQFAAFLRDLPALRARLEAHGVRLVGEKMVKLGDFLASRDALAMYGSLIRRDNALVPTSVLTDDVQQHFDRLKQEGFNTAEIMMLLDTIGYMPGDPLTKVDRASMAVALETRTPFLDHHLYALSWSLPREERIKNGETKHIIRNLLAKYVPKNLFERPKAGFGVPISAWLAGPLRPWVAEIGRASCRERVSSPV